MSGAHFAVHNFVGLTKQGAAFAVPEHNVMHKQIAEQRSADLARKSAAPLPIHVLRANLYVLRFAERFHHFRNRRERRHDHHFYIGDLAQVQQHRLDKSRGLGLRHVHLPIGGDDFFAHMIRFPAKGSELKIDERRVVRRNK